jgi:hypothetical protein
MDPLTARMRCLELAAEIVGVDEDATHAAVLIIACAYWDWVMDPFKLVDANAPDEDDESATRQ